MAEMLGVDLELTTGAMVAGGILGEHCSPISVTTIAASLASGTDHMDHVKTQFPCAAAAAGVSVALHAPAALGL